MIKIFYKDDFKVLFHRTDAMGNALAIPTHDWKATVYTEFGYANQGVVASSINGVVTGAVVKEKEIVFAIDNHNLQPGRVMIDWEEFIPDTDFPDGTRRVFRTYNSGSELVLAEGDSQTAIVNALLPYQYDSAYHQAVKGGYKGTQEEYFALANELPNAVETAMRIKGSAESLADSAEQIGGAIETLGATTDAIEQGANVIKNNADTLQASADKVGESASAVEQAVEPLVQASESLDATKQAFEMLSSEWSDGRQAIATALTNRRYPTEPSESFHAMADKITNMSYEEGWFAKIGYTDENAFALKEMIDYSYELAKGWNPDGSTAQMFRNNKNLIFLPYLNWSNVLNMDYAFENCTGLIFTYRLDLCSATSLDYTFRYCSAPVIYLKNTHNVSNWGHGTFSAYTGATSALKKIDYLDWSSISAFNAGIFNGQVNLSFLLIKNLGKSKVSTFPFTSLTSWGTGSDENRQSLIDSLITYSYDRASNGMATATITLSANTKALLTEEEIAQITNKGFTIS